ncbi:MAG: glycosyltransferase family 4 protein [Anaerolineaceae bacterium]|nr:glycosyltransferase family 4 protein [Anaerolineaceae bacterium]
MKIALIHYAAPPVVGGVESVISRQAELFTQFGHQALIITGRGAAWDGRIPVIVIPGLDSRNPEVLALKASLDRGEVPAGFEPATVAIQADLQEVLVGVEVVIAHNVASLHMNLALTAALYRLSQMPGAPRLILWHHDLACTAPRYQNELHPGWPWELLRKAWPGATQVVVSQPRCIELAHLLGIPEARIAVIPAGIDLKEFLRISSETWSLYERLGMVSAQPLLLTPVRLTARKNLEQGLHILKALRGQLPHAQLVITGPPGAHNPNNDTYFQTLRHLRQSLGLAGAVHFLAEIRPEGLRPQEVVDFYQLADALLITSREEGFGIPILEAGLARLPIFCTGLDALRDLAREWGTYFSPEEAPQVVADVIAKRLNQDPTYQMRLRVRTEFTWQAVYRQRIAPLLESQ